MRTFRHKVTINDAGAIVVFGLGSFSCLWNRTNSLMIVLGVLLVVVTIRAVDRAIHTEYVLTDDGVLQVTPGRVGRTRRIELKKIKKIGKRPFAFRLGVYALIELEDGSVVSVQPDNMDGFLSALGKRIETKEK